MAKINWTTPKSPGGVIYATLEGSDKRFATLGETAMGMMLLLYPSGATGEGKNHRVASVEQGKRFLERWVRHHESRVRRVRALSGQPGWLDQKAAGRG